MKDLQWIFDGIGTTIVSLLIGLIFGGISGYKFAIKKNSVQKQFAKENAHQRQEMEVELTDNLKEGKKSINFQQNQNAGNYSKQVQIGSIRNGE